MILLFDGGPRDTCFCCLTTIILLQPLQTQTTDFDWKNNNKRGEEDGEDGKLETGKRRRAEWRLLACHRTRMQAMHFIRQGSTVVSTI